MIAEDVTLAGKKYPLLFSFGALCEIERMTGQNMYTGQTTLNLTNIRAMTYCAMKHGAEYIGEKWDKTLEEVGELIGVGNNHIELITKVYLKQMGVDTDTEGDTEDKKKESP